MLQNGNESYEKGALEIMHHVTMSPCLPHQAMPTRHRRKCFDFQWPFSSTALMGKRYGQSSVPTMPSIWPLRYDLSYRRRRVFCFLFCKDKVKILSDFWIVFKSFQRNECFTKISSQLMLFHISVIFHFLHVAPSHLAFSMPSGHKNKSRR